MYLNLWSGLICWPGLKRDSVNSSERKKKHIHVPQPLVSRNPHNLGACKKSTLRVGLGWKYGEEWKYRASVWVGGAVGRKGTEGGGELEYRERGE